MKKILLFMGVISLGTNAMAQLQVEQGNIIIDPYIGVPNWANSIIYNQVSEENSGATDYKVNGGALSYGGRVEYMVADDFGVGVDINYEVSGYNFNDTVFVYEPISGTYTTTKYNYDYKAKKLRAMFRLNYHFVQNERVDAYTAFAAGYKNVNRTFGTNDPNGVNDDLTGALVPVTFRLAVGARIYFTNNIGAHVELGAFGGGLLQFGISAKF
jgi:hypothetical protein